MLYDLSFLDIGAPWPPPAESSRLARYRQNRWLYESLHERVYSEWWRTLRQDIHASLEVVVDFPKRLSNLWADLLVGDPPSLHTSDSEAGAFLDQLVRESELHAVLWEVAIDVSRFGDGLLKVRMEDGMPRIEAVSPEIWFPVVRRGNVRHIERHVLAYTITTEEQGWLGRIGEKSYLYAEIHGPDQIEYRFHELDGAQRIGKPADPHAFFPDWPAGGVETNPAGVPLILHVPNQRTSNRLFGYDDYTAIDSHLQRLEVRLAQWARINDRHADPPMAGPPLEVPDPESAEAERVAAGEKYFVIEPGIDGKSTPIPQYITWDQNVDSIKSEIEEIKEQMYIDSETSPTAFGISKTGYAESGTSLKLRMQSSLAKAARLRTAFDPALRRALTLAGELSGVALKDVQVGWKDGLPEDPKEVADIEAQKVQNGLTSRVSAIMRLENISREAAEEELARILDEERAASMSATPEQIDRTRQILAQVIGNGQNANG
ncbi:MAG: phage portal protein [Rubrobacteraceae bacterium]|nr:phage portal protein [Rubrobacteraceae bacterium]